MGSNPHKVLLADADRDELAKLAELVEAAGHEVVALTITPGETGDAIVEHKPTMAMILIEGDEEHAVDLMVEIRSFADIPLVVMARRISDASLRRAADQALEVLHMPGEPETVAKVIETAAARFQEWRGLERRVGEFDGVLERRSMIEQAKGILMERHSIDANEAFGRIREHARANQVRVADVAASIITARDLLEVPETAP
jgi:AmiR/NasT family two-component response regulator